MKLDTMLVGFVGEVSTVQNEQDSSIRNSYSILLAGFRTPNSAMISQRLDVQDLFHATVITTHHFVYLKLRPTLATCLSRLRFEEIVTSRRRCDRGPFAQQWCRLQGISNRGFVAVDVHTDATLSLKKLAKSLAVCSVSIAHNIMKCSP